MARGDRSPTDAARRRRGSRVVAVGLSLALAAACSSGSPSRTGRPAPRTSSSAGLDPLAGVNPPAATSATGTPGVKNAMVGLVDFFGPPPRSYFAAGVHGFVVNVAWAQLQPRPGGPITRPNAIDRAVATARALGPSARVKIRLFAGIHAPAWVKSLGGPPITMTVPSKEALLPSASAQAPRSGTSPVRVTLGRFWTAAYEHAYATLQARLAAAYDDVPQIADITIAGCATVFDEPLTLQARTTLHRQALLAAGYSLTADQSCLEASIRAHQVWRHTRSSLSVNPYQAVLPSGRLDIDEAFTESLMNDCRRVLGPRCVLENNSLRVPVSRLGRYFARMYAHLRALGPPITLQTANPKVAGCLTRAQCPGHPDLLDAALELRATSVELQIAFDPKLNPPAELTGYIARFAANALR